MDLITLWIILLLGGIQALDILYGAIVFCGAAWDAVRSVKD